VTLEEFLSKTLYYGNWPAVVGWFLLFASFLAFLPYNKKAKVKPQSTFIAFIVASAFEMFGVPLSLYFVAWAFGVTLPRGLLWGHTLENYIGYWGMYLGVALNVVGGLLIVGGVEGGSPRVLGEASGGGEAGHQRPLLLHETPPIHRVHPVDPRTPIALGHPSPPSHVAPPGVAVC